ncbi:MAG: TraR/DksA C4-type zinc finger protein [Opitutales bacterium]|nr:TraR/DksA C4-type zinc finger protein [Opitutales bacterium]
MPAKKSAAAKKDAPKKSAAKKPATKKAAVRKAPKKAPIGDAGKPANPSAATTPTPEAAKNGKEKKIADASEALKRRPHHTPPIFKVPSRRQAPIVFTLEDVREHLKKRLKEQKAAEADAAAKAAEEAAAQIPVETAKVDAPAVASAPVQAGKRAAASLEDILGLTGGGATQSKTVPAKWQHYHNLLTELRDHVKSGLAQHSSDTLKRSQKEDAGDLATSSDAGTDTFDRDFALSMLSTEQEALKEIEAAIDRIYKGTYGTCEITGQAISKERLEAVPFTRFSLEGQRQHELTARRRVQRTGAFLNEGSAEGVTFGDDDNDD